MQTRRSGVLGFERARDLEETRAYGEIRGDLQSLPRVLSGQQRACLPR